MERFTPLAIFAAYMWTCRVLVRSQSEGNATTEIDRGWTKFLGVLHKDQRGQATVSLIDPEYRAKQTAQTGENPCLRQLATLGLTC